MDYIQYILDFSDRYNYPKEAVDTFVDIATKLKNDNDLGVEFFALIDRYAKEQKIFDYSNHLSGKNDSICDKICKKYNISPYTADFVYCLHLIPTLQKMFEAEGLSDAVFYDSMTDFKCKLQECIDVKHVYGSFVAGWFAGWFKLDRLAFGRLQYEVRPNLWFMGFLHCGKKIKFVPMWHKFLNIHIPSSGKLDQTEVQKSYKLAYDYFSKHGLGKTIVYHTSSWLLSPDHPKYLPKTSNIVAFCNNFRVFNTCKQHNNEDFWRVFYRDYNKTNPDLSGNTTLQKIYAKIIGDGKKMQSGSGIFVYDGKNFYK